MRHFEQTCRKLKVYVCFSFFFDLSNLWHWLAPGTAVLHTQEFTLFFWISAPTWWWCCRLFLLVLHTLDHMLAVQLTAFLKSTVVFFSLKLSLTSWQLLEVLSSTSCKPTVRTNRCYQSLSLFALEMGPLMDAGCVAVVNRLCCPRVWREEEWMKNCHFLGRFQNL